MTSFSFTNNFCIAFPANWCNGSWEDNYYYLTQMNLIVPCLIFPSGLTLPGHVDGYKISTLVILGSFKNVLLLLYFHKQKTGRGDTQGGQCCGVHQRTNTVPQHTHSHWGGECGGMSSPACACVCVFPAIVRRRLIPPLYSDRQLSRLPELIIKRCNSQSLKPCLSVCPSACQLPSQPAFLSVCLPAWSKNISLLTHNTQSKKKKSQQTPILHKRFK